MKTIIFCTISACLLLSCNNQPAAENSTTTAPAAETKKQPTEFADAKYIDVGKKALAAMTSGNTDEWMSIYADNVKYYYNNGDSLIGKQAVDNYWRKRRSEVIDSISFASEIWLPVKVNEPQQPQQLPGVWLLSWYQVNVKYKTGKSMGQWMHVDYHFDANDKVDEVVHYLDRAPINAATAK